jgi:hypothetical protein
MRSGRIPVQRRVGNPPLDHREVRLRGPLAARLRALLAALLLGACAHGSSANARLFPVCARNDGPAVMFQVPANRNAEYPYFRLRVERRLGEVASQRIVVTNPDAAGPSAEWCDANGCRVIRSATPTVAAFGPLGRDSSVAVHLTAAQPDGKPFAWNGTARWKGEALICG